MHKSYQKFAQYYDSMHQRRNYKHETDFIVNKIKELNPEANSLLDVGCGTGSHLSLLEKNFTSLSGVDLNEEILQVARAKCPSITFQQGKMGEFKLSQKFDAITCLYSVFNYNLDLEEAEKTLNNFARHLNDSGVLVIALYKAKNTEKKVSIHVGKLGDMESAKINDYVYDPKTKAETSNFVLFWKKDGKVDFETENNHKFRIFEYEEINTLLEKIGFTSPEYFEGYTDQVATEKTSYPVLVCQKK